MPAQLTIAYMSILDAPTWLVMYDDASAARKGTTWADLLWLAETVDRDLVAKVVPDLVRNSPDHLGGDARRACRERV